MVIRGQLAGADDRQRLATNLRNRVRLIAWLLRLAAIIVAGALLTTAVVVGIGPRLWRVANAHDQLPVTLPEFQPLSQRSYVYDVTGNVIAVFERENSQPITLEQVPPGVLSAFLAVEDEQYYIAPRRQPSRLRPGVVVELLQRCTAPRCEHDHVSK